MFFPLHNFNRGWVAEEDTWAAAPPIGTDLDTTGMGKLLIIKRKKKRIEEPRQIYSPMILIGCEGLPPVDPVEPGKDRPGREAELYQVRNLPESMWTNPDPG